MAYTLKQLSMAYTAVHNGIAPDAATLTTLESFVNLTVTDEQALSYILNSADNSTAVAALTYQFFTGKSPTQAGLTYLLNSPDNANDLSDAYYAKFNIENRYINFAANLGVQGEGAAAFAAKYGAMSFNDYVASIYETIIGSSYAKAAGIDVAAAIAYVISTKDKLLATARDAGLITPNMTAAQVDLAVKAAAAGLLMAAGIKADVGVYAASANNFMLALAQDKAVYNTSLVDTYATPSGSSPLGSNGTGKAVDSAPTVLPGAPVVVPPPPAPVALSFTLTGGADAFTGDSLNDTFTATNATLNAGDVLDGGFGIDTLTITASGAYTAPAATVSGIEIVNIVNNNIVTANTTTWAGVTQLNVTSVGGDDLTAASTTNVSLTAGSVGSNNVFIKAGQNVVLNETGVSTGNITVGGTSPITGTVTLNVSQSSPGSSGGAITVNGGTTVAVNVTNTNAVATTQVTGTISVTGGPNTTSVTIAAPRAVAQSGGTAGVVANSVAIIDANSGSSTKAGTITSISVDGYTTLGIADTALTTLSLAHGSGNIIIDNSGLTVATNKTLNLTVNGLTGGTLDDADIYTTYNVTTGAENSTLANITNSALTALNLSGASKLTITSTAGLSALQTVTVTGAASLTANLSGASVKSVDASGTSGPVTVTIDSSKATYAGGSGVDIVTLAATAGSKSLTLGGGNDTLDATALTTVISGTNFNAGAGTADVLKITAAGAAASSASGSSISDFVAAFTGFEVLSLSGAAGAQTVDVGGLGNFASVMTNGIAAAGALTLQNFANNGTLTITGDAGAGGGYVVSNAAFTGGSTDVVNLFLSKAGLLAAGSVTAANVETINITTADTQGTPTNPLDTLTLVSTAATKVTVSGNAGLNLTDSATTLTTVDASGITAGSFTWTSGALASTATVKGSATGTNTIDFSAATGGAVTYTGGTGNDIVTASNGKANVISLGAGDNSLTGTSGLQTVTAGAGNDTVSLTTGNNSINLGDGTNAFTATSGDNSYTGGTGVDTVTVGGGQNSIDVGSGLDVVNITAANVASNTIFTTITGFGAGDKLTISPGGSLAPTAVGAEITGQASLAAYLDAAAAGDGSGTAIIHWFQFAGNTYIVQDMDAGANFAPGVDIVVKLVGPISLATSSVTAGQITI